MARGGVIDEATIGETPLVELDVDLPQRVFAKVEWFNLYSAPYGGGSVKSRIAKAMIDGAEAAGELPGKTIIEPTSGNTGSEVARIGTARGYDVEIVMPDNASGGKIAAIRDAGATIHFVNADLGYDAVLERCDELVAGAPDRYYRPNQYTNPANPRAHETTTAPEIWAQTDGCVTHFIAGVGTGGTVTGVGRGLADRGAVSIIGVEPANPLHAIDGLKYLRSGDHYHPETYDESVLDDKRYVDTSDAYAQARSLRERYATREVRIHDSGQHPRDRVESYLRVGDHFVVGTSSGAVLQAATDIAANDLDTEAIIVVVFADRGDKYADIPLWNDLL